MLTQLSQHRHDIQYYDIQHDATLHNNDILQSETEWQMSIIIDYRMCSRKGSVAYNAADVNLLQKLGFWDGLKQINSFWMLTQLSQRRHDI